MTERKSQIIFLLIAVFISSYVFLDSLRLTFKNKIFVICVFSIFILTVLLEVFNMIRHNQRKKTNRLTNADLTEKEVLKEENKDIRWHKSKKIYLTGVLVLCLVLMKIFGFFVATFISYVILTYLLGTRKFMQLFIVPSCLLIIIFFLFVRLFSIKLPSGVFF